MQDIFKYNVFPHLNYIEIRNFCQCTKRLFPHTAYEFKSLSINDNDMITYLHCLKLDKLEVNYANIYKEIYGKTLCAVLKAYPELPDFVIKDKFLDIMCLRCVKKLRMYQFTDWNDLSNRKLNIPEYVITLALVSVNSDIMYQGAGDFDIQEFDLSDECKHYIKKYEFGTDFNFIPFII